MTRRDLMALLAGAGIALAVASVFLRPGVVGVGQAQAQQEMTPERLRLMTLALANALASVAVDGERTAVAHNQTVDRVAALEARVRLLEKRLADLESRR